MARSVYDTNIIVKIPEGAHICGDKRVYIVTESRYYKDLQYNMDVKVWLGKAISDKEMHPSQDYKRLYPNELKKIPHLNLPHYHKPAGMYAITLSIAERLGIYSDLVEYIGPENANLVMDYAMYSILFRTNAAKDFEAAMKRHMLFLGKSYSDTWIGEKFQNDISDDHIAAFKEAWLKRFSDQDHGDIWICIDGSNNNCTAQIPEAEKGKAKSHKNVNIISFLYAVTEDGMPVCSSVYRGSKVDAKALIGMAKLLRASGITPKGVILDRGFCDDGTIQLLEDEGFNYVIKMKETILGFTTLLAKYRDELKFSWKYALGNGLYGITDEVQLFKTKDRRANCVLIWDAKNGGMRTDYLVDGLLETISEIEDRIRRGEVPTIPAKYASYLKITPSGEGCELIVKEDAIQEDMQNKGYSGLICSTSLTAKEANRIYDFRDNSETQYAILKTQLGSYTFRAHQMHGIRVREITAFVAGVIRCEILNVCRAHKPKYDVNQVIKEMNLITMDLSPDRNYELSYDELSTRQKQMLECLGVKEKELDRIVQYENQRFSGAMAHPVQTMKSPEAPAETENVKKTVTRIQGIPEGSKAKGKGAKTLKQQDDQAVKFAESETAPPVKRRGRPPGSKNKPKDPNAVKVSRPRGRPPGSKNKPKMPQGGTTS